MASFSLQWIYVRYQVDKRLHMPLRQSRRIIEDKYSCDHPGSRTSIVQPVDNDFIDSATENLLRRSTKFWTEMCWSGTLFRQRPNKSIKRHLDVMFSDAVYLLLRKCDEFSTGAIYNLFPHEVWYHNFILYEQYRTHAPSLNKQVYTLWFPARPKS